jgi:hypothetical protein
MGSSSVFRTPRARASPRNVKGLLKPETITRMADDLPAVFLVEGDGHNKRLKPFASPKVFAESNLERDIETWVKNSMLSGVPVLGELALFAQQPGYKASQARRPDLLALDGDRNVVVIEFKRDRAPEDIVFQTLNYAAWIAEQSYEVLNAFATGFFARLPESNRPSSLKEAYYQRFPATTVDGASEEEEPALPTDQEFLAGFNTKPRIILVATEIGDEIQRVMRFLSAHGVNMEGHEFQYFLSPQGDELVHRQTVGVVSVLGPTPPSAGPAYHTLDELADYVEDDTVRQWIAAIQAWGDELPFRPEVRFAVPGNGNWRVRFLGKTRAQGYFAKRWAFVWWSDRFDQDVQWFKERLSAPDQVQVDGTGTLRFHLRTTGDLGVLKTALQSTYERSASS